MLKQIGLAIGGGIRAIGRAVPSLLLNVFGLGSVGAISYGAWLVYQPAGFIVGGALTLTGVVLLAMKR